MNEKKPMRRIIIATPSDGGIGNSEDTVGYARACALDCISRGEMPYAGALLLSLLGIPRIQIPEKYAESGAGLPWDGQSGATVFYSDRGKSPEMRAEWDRALAEGRVIEERTLPDYGMCMRGSKFILGIAGRNRSGKGTLAETMIRMIAAMKTYPEGFGIVSFRSSDVLFACLDMCGIGKSRANAQYFVQRMEKLRPGFLSDAMRKRLESAGHKVALFDGVRTMSDVQMLRKIDGTSDAYGRTIKSLLVFIDAKFGLRLERAKAAKEKSGEEHITRGQFRKEDRCWPESELGAVKKNADLVIANNGTPEAFEAAVRQRVFEERMRPYVAVSYYPLDK